VKCHLWYSLTASLYCFVCFFGPLQKNITTGIVFTAMDNSASLSKVGGHRIICSQSHEIMFHVHRFGKTEANWEAEQSGCKKGDRGMWFIIMHCALYFLSVRMQDNQAAL